MLLSIEAIHWLDSINYESKSLEERMKLIEAAKIAYPNPESDIPEELRSMPILGLT